MPPHAPADLIRPPDPAQINPPSTIYNSTEGNPQQQSTAAAILEQCVDGTVQQIATRSPPRRSHASGQKCEKLNRPIDSPPYKTPTLPFSGHSGTPSMTTGPATYSGDLQTGNNGKHLTAPLKNDHQSNTNTLKDPSTTPIATNYNPIVPEKINTHLQNLNLPPACENAQMKLQSTVEQRGGYQKEYAIANPTFPTHQVQDGTKHISTVGDKKKNNTAAPLDIGSDPLPKDHFPPLRQIKISSNFDRMEGAKVNQNVAIRDTTIQKVQPVVIPQRNNSENNHVSVSMPAPQPPKVIPSYANRLRAAQIHDEQKLELSPPTITTKQGLPAVLFKREDFMVKLAEKCKFTVIGKFSNTMPKMEVIRRSLTSQLQIKGTCKVTHFNSKHVYIDLENEIDHTTVWNKEKIWVQGMQMRLFVWTPTFKPQEETTVAPVWVILPELPWHCYRMEFVSRLLAPIGRVLFFDAATLQKTRGSVVKVKIEIDITKPRVHHVWMGFPEEDDDVFGDGKWQEIQFEHVPEYCGYCKHQGHADHACIIKRREEDQSNRKEEQAEKKKKQAENPDLQMQENSKTGFDSKQVPEETTKQALQGKNQWQTQKRKGTRVTNNQENTKRQAEEGQKHIDTKRNDQNVKQVYQPRQGQDRSNATVSMQPNVHAQYPLNSEKGTENVVVPVEKGGVVTEVLGGNGINELGDVNTGELICTNPFDALAQIEIGATGHKNQCFTTKGGATCVDAVYRVNPKCSDALQLPPPIETTKSWVNRSFGKIADAVAHNSVLSASGHLQDSGVLVHFPDTLTNPNYAKYLGQQHELQQLTLTTETTVKKTLPVSDRLAPAVVEFDKFSGCALPGKKFVCMEEDAHATQNVNVTVEPSDVTTKPVQVLAEHVQEEKIEIPDTPTLDTVVQKHEKKQATDTGRKKKKKKSRKIPAAGTPKRTAVMETAGELIQEQQTEEDIRKAKIRAWQDAILAKSYAENPIMESNIEPLNVLENKAADSIPSQESFDPAYAITMGTDNDANENDKGLAEYLSPAQSGNKLIPTARLEVICKKASKALKEIGRGFHPITHQTPLDHEGHELPTYYLGDLFHDTQNAQSTPSKGDKSKWNLDAPLFIPNARRQQEAQVPVESVDSQDGSDHKFPKGPSDEVLLQTLDLHDIRGLLHRQNSPPQDLPQKYSSPHPGIIEDGSEYEDEDEESTAYNHMAEARFAGLSPRLEQAVKPKLIKKKRRPLELPNKREAAPKKPKRVQPTRSSKSRSSRRK